MEQKSTLSNSSVFENKVIFGGKYLLTHHEGTVVGYNNYEGVDIKSKAKIFAFVKQIKNNESIKFRKDLNDKLDSHSAKFLWAGEEKVGIATYHAEIFQKLGPSMSKVIATLGSPPLTTCFLLVFNLLKLIQKLSQLNIVYRGLNWSRLYLSAVPGFSNELFLYEYLGACKKGDAAPISDTPTTSIGSHLGLAASFKDDFQSVCYMSFEFFYKRGIFQNSYNIKNKGSHLLTKKTQLNLEGNKTIPAQFIQMYLYVRNMPNNECPNYDYWKKTFRRELTPQIMRKPFFFGTPTVQESKEDSEGELQIQSDQNLQESSHDEDAIWVKVSRFESLKVKALRDCGLNL